MIDLHTHTVYSDGSASVCELLRIAQRLSLSHLSITDHDAVGAYRELSDPAVRGIFSGKIIPGVELTALYNGEIVEVLGYGIDIEVMSELINQNVKPFIDTIEDQSRIYMPAFLKYGVEFDKDFVDLITSSPETVFADRRVYSQGVYLEQMRKFPSNVRFFKDMDEFMNISVKDFTRLFIYNPKSTLYADLSPIILTADRACDLIHKAGGLAFLAHPYIYSETVYGSLEQVVKALPLDGAEYSYTTFTKEQSEYLNAFCKKHSLYKSCGSDFHGLDVKPDNNVGYGTEQTPLYVEDVQPWLDKVTVI